MSEPFVGQVEAFSFNFPPKGWTTCSGQLLSIQQNTALFSLLGTTYGGNGQTNFGLPDLRGRVPVGWGQGHGLSPYVLGQKGGEEAHTLSTSEMAAHNHSLMCDTSVPATNNTNVPSTSVVLGNTVGKQSGVANPFSLTLYTSGAPGGILEGHSIGFTGGSQGHNNLMPYLAINFCIALVGIFPSRN
jgi:microcystin-dependent protein